MATLAPQAPWAMRLVTDRLPIGPPSYAAVTLDEPTQKARYTDAAGRPVEMGQHGTNQTTPTASQSGGSDGSSPQPQSTDDSNPDYSSD
ncbi:MULTISPECIES: putative ATP-grasp-modified RiPP [unclassified Streptomyces]|uniref:putative ATP-grasp-modified RiPP n=1 Tax=unclassified Streptomyces TaxID=2593676 RepID=UPI002883F7B5|nr:putative ATP-grasp-modified RiPP [Streptomyces sp. DSM 41633]